MKIEMLPGLTTDHVACVHKAGVKNCQQLLRASRRVNGLTALASSSGLSVETLQEIVARAAMTRIRGIGPATLTALLELGITSLAELAAESPTGLRDLLRQSTASPPNLAVIEYWIRQAQQQIRM